MDGFLRRKLQLEIEDAALQREQDSESVARLVRIEEELRVLEDRINQAESDLEAEKLILRDLRDAQEQRALLLERAVQASNDERRRIAGTLHDGVIQDLAGASYVVSGAAAAWQQVCEGGFGEGLAGRAATLDLDQVLARAARSRCRFVVPGDDEWPERIGDLRYCDEVQRRGGVPFGLWLRGPGHLAQLTERSVAVVGSRIAMVSMRLAGQDYSYEAGREPMVAAVRQAARALS